MMQAQFPSLSLLLRGIAGAVLVGLTLSATAQVEEAIDPTRFDGLVPVDDAKVQMAYIDPEADFTVFRRVMILDPYVAFRANWKRDQNRNRTTRVRPSDAERIRADVANLFRDVFIERLQADDGFEVVHERGPDVLVLRPAIIDLDVTAPDVRQAGRSRTHTATSGAATMYIELIDSISGDIIGRAADRRTIRTAGGGVSVTWTNRVTNVADARRMFGRWADQLRAFLDSHYLKKAE